MPEQLPVDPTIWWNGDRTPEGKRLCKFSRRLRNGKARLCIPGTDTPVKMNGDIIRSIKEDPNGILKMWWDDQWVPIPTVDEFMEWTVDSCCPTPDGSIVEPDAPESWLSLVGLV